MGSSKTFYEMLDVLCDLRGITVEDFFEQSMGITMQDRIDYKNKAEPSEGFRASLADFFGMPIEQVDSEECLERNRKKIAKSKEKYVSEYELKHARGNIDRIQRQLDKLEDEFNNGTDDKQIKLFEKHLKQDQLDTIISKVFERARKKGILRDK